ncbi:MAG: tryptophan synthase subunit alpha [Ruminococcaceae bacterium]|nr:tryptophan synthase subunit alpha [Oscillospiraceae bacterium]
MNKLTSAFSARKAIAAYFTCGDPTAEATVEAANAAISAGADILFLGIPFSDPTAVDPVIQESSLRGLADGTTTKTVMETAKRFSDKVPVVLTGYANLVFSPGIENFAKQCEDAGVTGVILHDVPFEEQEEFKAVFRDYGISLISMVSPELPERIGMIAKEAEGFLYIVTGAETNREAVQNAVRLAKEANPELPCIIGCGVADAAPIESFCEEADGAVLDYELVYIMDEYPVGAKRHITAYVEHIDKLLNG